jgi:hypothetical protein
LPGTSIVPRKIHIFVKLEVINILDAAAVTNILYLALLKKYNGYWYYT